MQSQPVGAVVRAKEDIIIIPRECCPEFVAGGDKSSCFVIKGRHSSCLKICNAKNQHSKDDNNQDADDEDEDEDENGNENDDDYEL